MKHDAWMNDLFWRNSNLSLEPRNTCCLYCTMPVHVKMWRAAGVSVYTPRRLPGNSNFRQAKNSISELKKSPLFSPG